MRLMLALGNYLNLRGCALSVSKRTLNYLKKLDEFHLAGEESIRYWTAWLIQMMKVTCEPSGAISMAAITSLF